MQVGDIMQTTRNNLTSDFLRCNGESFDPIKYPKLAALESSTYPHPWTAATNNAPGNLNSVAYGNGYWVAVGEGGTIYYRAGTPDGTWSSMTQGSTYLFSVAYGNGYWVVVGENNTIYYKAGNPNGTWTTNPHSSRHQWIAYINGYWIATGSNNMLWCKPGTPDGAWTNIDIGISSALVAYGNGYWVAIGENGLLKYKTGTPTGAWTANNQNAGSGTFRSINYIDWSWVATDNFGAFYSSANTPLGIWENVKSSESVAMRGLFLQTTTGCLLMSTTSTDIPCPT